MDAYDSIVGQASADSDGVMGGSSQYAVQACSRLCCGRGCSRHATRCSSDAGNRHGGAGYAGCGAGGMAAPTSAATAPRERVRDSIQAGSGIGFGRQRARHTSQVAGGHAARNAFAIDSSQGDSELGRAGASFGNATQGHGCARPYGAVPDRWRHDSKLRGTVLT